MAEKRSENPVKVVLVSKKHRIDPLQFGMDGFRQLAGDSDQLVFKKPKETVFKIQKKEPEEHWVGITDFNRHYGGNLVGRTVQLDNTVVCKMVCPSGWNGSVWRGIAQTVQTYEFHDNHVRMVKVYEHEKPVPPAPKKPHLYSFESYIERCKQELDD